jgi:hypothetical protein
MNAKADGWESYTDRVGRRHWRWPAASERQQDAAGAGRARTPAEKIGLPGPAAARSALPLPTGK